MELENDPDGEEMGNVNLDGERERHWRMVFEDNGGGVENANELLHAKRWDVYVNEKLDIVQGGYWWKFLVMMGRRLFGKCSMIMS